MPLRLTAPPVFKVIKLEFRFTVGERDTMEPDCIVIVACDRSTEPLRWEPGPNVIVPDSSRFVPLPVIRPPATKLWLPMRCTVAPVAELKVPACAPEACHAKVPEVEETVPLLLKPVIPSKEATPDPTGFTIVPLFVQPPPCLVQSPPMVNVPEFE